MKKKHAPSTMEAARGPVPNAPGEEPESPFKSQAMDNLLHTLASTPTKTAATSGFQLFKSSDHPAKPKNADVRHGKGDMAAFSSLCAQIYSQLPDREVFEKRAMEVNAARRAVIPEADAPRVEYVLFFVSLPAMLADLLLTGRSSSSSRCWCTCSTRLRIARATLVGYSSAA